MIWIVITWIVTTQIILNLKSLTCRVETNTSEEEEQHCCLDSVIVDFAALGWHFILSPPVLEFTYCRLLSLTLVVVCYCFCLPWFAFHPLPAKTNPRVYLPQVFDIALFIHFVKSAKKTHKSSLTRRQSKHYFHARVKFWGKYPLSWKSTYVIKKQIAL